MNNAELRERFIKEIREMEQQARRLPELLASGQVAKVSNGWYELRDQSVLHEIGKLGEAIKFALDGGFHRIKILNLDQLADLGRRC
jgi:hypothetical protein